MAARPVDVLADLAGVAYFQVDPEGRIVAASPALADLTGIDRDELVGSPCLTVMRCRECLEGCPVREDEELRDARVTLHRNGDGPLQVIHSGRVLRNADGEAEGCLEVLRPVNGYGSVRDHEGPEVYETPPGLSREERVELRRIRQALEKARYRRTRAAELLGISRTTLWRKMKQYRLL